MLRIKNSGYVSQFKIEVKMRVFHKSQHRSPIITNVIIGTNETVCLGKTFEFNAGV